MRVESDNGVIASLLKMIQGNQQQMIDINLRVSSLERERDTEKVGRIDCETKHAAEKNARVECEAKLKKR